LLLELAAARAMLIAGREEPAVLVQGFAVQHVERTLLRQRGGRRGSDEDGGQQRNSQSIFLPREAERERRRKAGGELAEPLDQERGVTQEESRELPRRR